VPDAGCRRLRPSALSHTNGHPEPKGGEHPPRLEAAGKICPNPVLARAESHRPPVHQLATGRAPVGCCSRGAPAGRVSVALCKCRRGNTRTDTGEQQEELRERAEYANVCTLCDCKLRYGLWRRRALDRPLQETARGWGILAVMARGNRLGMLRRKTRTGVGAADGREDAS